MKTVMEQDPLLRAPQKTPEKEETRLTLLHPSSTPEAQLSCMCYFVICTLKLLIYCKIRSVL